MQAFKFNLEVGVGGEVTLPRLRLNPGTSVDVVILVPDTEEGLRRLAAETMDFLDNPVDDAVWGSES